MLYLFNFFFFQAEDGIRYHCVTGVQTCALPISRRPPRSSGPRPPGRPAPTPFSSSPPITTSPPKGASWRISAPPRRSEERRVGKECRARWVRYCEKNTKTRLLEVVKARIVLISV